MRANMEALLLILEDKALQNSELPTGWAADPQGCPSATCQRQAGRSRSWCGQRAHPEAQPCICCQFEEEEEQG